MINRKVELKHRWTKPSVLAAAGVDIDNIYSSNIIFTPKDAKSYVSVDTLSTEDNERLSQLLRKEFERSVYGSECKTNSENKNLTNEYKYFLVSNSVGVNRLFVLIYLNQGDNA